MKRLKQVSLFLVATIALLVTTVLMQRVDPNQQKGSNQPYLFADTLANHIYSLDSLKEIIGRNKGLPPGFEVAAAIAYSAYPELKDVDIDMVLTQDGAPMESAPVISSLFGSRKNRKYQILLNDNPNDYLKPILLRSLPFDAQVGILAHELGHVVYYDKLNIFQFGKWGLKYLQEDDFRAAHERSTDLMPMYHGLGSQIYQYAYFVRKDSSCIEFYQHAKGFIDKYYMTDEEIWSAINE